MTSIDKPFVRSLLLRDKPYLEQIFHSEDEIFVIKLIKNLEVQVLNTIIILCHLITNHVIKLSKESGKIIISKKKQKFLLTNFKSVRTFHTLIENTKTQKINILLKLIPVLPSLLSPLFMQKNGSKTNERD